MLQVDELLPDESILTKIKTKGFWLYFFSFIVAPVSYGIKIMVSHSMTVEEVGLIYSLLGFVGIIAAYNDLWLTDALQYYLPKYLLRKDFARAKGMMIVTFAIQAISGLLIGWGLYILSDRLAVSYFNAPEAGALLKFFGLYFLVVNFFQVIQSFFFAVQNVKLEKAIEFLRMLFVLLATAWFWYTDSLSLGTLSLSRFIGLCVASALAGYMFYRSYYQTFFLSPHLILRSDIMQQLGYGFRSLIGNNAWTIIAQIDLQIVIYYLGKEMAGYWTNYMSLNSLSTFIFVPLLSFMFPVFTELVEKKQFAKLRSLRNKLLRAILAYGVVLGVIVHFIGVRAAQKIFSSDYILSGQLLQHTAFVLFTPLLGIVNFQYIRSFGTIRRVTIAQVIVVVLHIAASLYIIHSSADPYDLALVLMISHLLFFLVTEWYIRRHRRITDVLPY